MKKILIVIGDAGGGHISCARAMKEAFIKDCKGYDIEIVDLFKLSKFTKYYDYFYYLVSTYPFFEFFYNIGYMLIDKSAFLAKILEIPTARSLYRPTMKLLKEKNPDLVLTNSCLTTLVLRKCKKKRDFNYVITVSDLIPVSRWWADSSADIIFCPTKDASKKIKGYNSECNTQDSYYPLREVEKYSKEKKSEVKERIFKKYKLKRDIPTVLITGCGIATRNIVKSMEEFIKGSKYQFLILTGKDERLKKYLERKYIDESRVSVLGFTKEIVDLFYSSDIVLAKPGPATLLEIEEVGKRAVFTRAVGYQEWGNVEYLEKNPNFSYVGSNYSSIPALLKSNLEKPSVQFKSTILGSSAIVSKIKEYYGLNKS